MMKECIAAEYVGRYSMKVYQEGRHRFILVLRNMDRGCDLDVYAYGSKHTALECLERVADSMATIVREGGSL